MKRIYGILILVATLLNVNAQSLWYERVDSVTKSGYYHIEISQELYGLGTHALRVLDADGKEVPYFMRLAAAMGEVVQMEMYPLISNTARDSVNTIVVHRTAGEVSHFYLKMKRADAAMHIAIRGSYDQQQWFGVKQRSRLRSEYNPLFGDVAVVDFPWGDYTYYELTVTNNTQNPLHITGVGRIERNITNGQLVELRSGGYAAEVDEDNCTRISFPGMKYPYALYGLTLEVEDKGHYSRGVEIVKEGRVMHSFQLSSREKGMHHIDELTIDRDTQIRIYNHNNPALTVTDVKLYGQNRYLCAYLEKNGIYRIATSKGGYRRYDIEDFIHDISTVLPVLKTHGLTDVEVPVVPPTPLRFYEKPFFLWGVIAVIGIGLLLLCVRMLKELKENGGKQA